MNKYEFNVWPDNGDITAFDSILDALKEARIFSIEKTGSVFVIGDEVDECFHLELTKDQLLSLADEISELARSMPAAP